MDALAEHCEHRLMSMVDVVNAVVDDVVLDAAVDDDVVVNDETNRLFFSRDREMDDDVNSHDCDLTTFSNS